MCGVVCVGILYVGYKLYYYVCMDGLVCVNWV